MTLSLLFVGVAFAAAHEVADPGSRIERHLRDALLARIGEGANEVLRGVVIPRILLKEFAKRGPAPLW